MPLLVEDRQKAHKNTGINHTTFILIGKPDVSALREQYLASR